MKKKKKNRKKKTNRYSPENVMKIGYRDFIGSAEARKSYIRSLNLIDDTFFAAVMEDPVVCAYVIGKIINRDDIVIKSCKVQYHIANMISHSVTLDVIAEDSEGKVYNIEVQKSDNDHHPKRIRYYQSNVDSVLLKKGLDYKELPETYFIFISKFDPFGLGDNYYEIERRIKGRDDIVTNGIHEIYINTKVKNGRSITSLLNYFTDSDPDSNSFGPLSEKVRFFKEDRKGEIIMCDKVQRLIDEAMEEERKEFERLQAEQQAAYEKQQAEQQAAYEKQQAAYEKQLAEQQAVYEKQIADFQAKLAQAELRAAH